MRMLPAYIAIRLITGASLRARTRGMTKVDRLREGHRMLVEMCGCDHSYDLVAWHEELRTSKAGGYSWGKRAGIPFRIRNALEDPAWNAAVAEITRQDGEPS